MHLTLIDRLTLIDLVTVWIQLNPAARFQFHVFTFFFSCTWTVTLYGFTVQGTKITIHALFITVHALKNIKNGSHGTIYTFKNYFATVLSVFSFNNNKLNPNGLIMLYLYIWFIFLVCNLTYIKLIYERVYLPLMHLCFGLWCLSEFVMFYLSFFWGKLMFYLSNLYNSGRELLLLETFLEI